MTYTNVKTSDLKANDNIRITYGCVGNDIECTVVSVSEKLFYGSHIVTAYAPALKREIEFCSAPADMIEKAA